MSIDDLRAIADFGLHIVVGGVIGALSALMVTTILHAYGIGRGWTILFNGTNWEDPITDHFFHTAMHRDGWRGNPFQCARDYYDTLETHWHPDCYIPDWRVVEVAVEFDLPPELAWADAVKKGFSQEG